MWSIFNTHTMILVCVCVRDYDYSTRESFLPQIIRTASLSALKAQSSPADDEQNLGSCCSAETLKCHLPAAARPTAH